MLTCLPLVGCGAPQTTPANAQIVSVPSAAPTRQTTATSLPTATPSSTATSTATATLTPLPTATLGPPPQIVASFPVDNDRAIPAERILWLRFDQPMDQASVAARLSLSPTISGALDWPDTNTCRFEPDSPWAPDTAYIWTLDEGALAQSGGRLTEPKSLAFQTGGPGAPIPILMYHHIKTLPEDASEGQRTWTVSPEALAEQITYLEQQGWQSITPNQLADYLVLGSPLPPKPVMLTFDDGYKELYDVVMPLLEPTRLRPVLFIVPEYLGYGAYLTWEQLAALAQADCIVGAHGYDHSDLRQASDDALNHQIVDSQKVLHEHLGLAVDAFCYAYGSYDERTLTLLDETGYRTGYTLNPSIYQHPDSPLQLSRLLVHYDMTLAEFAERVR